MQVSDPQFRALLDRYLNNTATQAERELLDEFFNSYWSGYPDRDLVDNAALGDEILNSVHSRLRRRSRPVRRTWLSVAAAAVVLVVLGYLIRMNLRTPALAPAAAQVIKIETQTGQRLVTHLPDGTTVYLNSESRLSYTENFGWQTRKVAIVGEAYFEVVHNGQPFIVDAGKMQTHVLGTAFNVKNRGDEHVEVLLVKGKVVVTTALDSAVLYPKQLAMLDKDIDAVQIRDANPVALTAWKDEVLFFEQTSLKEAIAVLEMWYAVEIDIADPEIEGCAITAKYNNEPLGNVLSSLQYLLGLDIKRLDEKHYRISGTGCR